MEENWNEVKLYIYDLSMGLAQELSQILLGKRFEGIWHTSIVIYEKEYYFGPNGVNVCDPGTTNLGHPKTIETLGTTYITEDLFQEYLSGLKQSAFAPGTYDLIKNNCNIFSNELSQFLVGKSIPKYILDLPDDVIQCCINQPFSPVATLLSQFVTSFRNPSPDYERLNNDIDAARQRSLQLEQRRIKIQEKLDRQERKKKKKKKRKNNFEVNSDEVEGSSSFSYKMSENINGVQKHESDQNNVNTEKTEEIEKSTNSVKKRQKEPPIVFSEIVNCQLQEEFDKIIGLVVGNVTPEEMQYFEELHKYLFEDEGSWAIGDGFLTFAGKLLNGQQYPPELKVRLLNVLAATALKEDIILILHQDRRDHVFMNYANNFDRLPVDEQKALALFVCNLFENPNNSEWLLYISEWDSNTGSISNIRVTTKIAANSLLSGNLDLQNYGTAIIHNLACKEVKTVRLNHGKNLRKLLPVGCLWKVFDDVAVELTMAILQFFNNESDEEKIFRCIKALAKFIQVAQQDVSQLIQMIGPHPEKFHGISDRVDHLISEIQAKLH